jgi:hypothetical protein
VGLREAILAVCLALFGAPGPAAARSGAGDCLSEPARELHFQVGGILFVDGGS